MNGWEQRWVCECLCENSCKWVSMWEPQSENEWVTAVSGRQSDSSTITQEETPKKSFVSIVPSSSSFPWPAPTLRVYPACSPASQRPCLGPGEEEREEIKGRQGLLPLKVTAVGSLTRLTCHSRLLLFIFICYYFHRFSINFHTFSISFYACPLFIPLLYQINFLGIFYICLFASVLQPLFFFSYSYIFSMSLYWFISLIFFFPRNFQLWVKLGSSDHFRLHYLFFVCAFFINPQYHYSYVYVYVLIIISLCISTVKRHHYVIQGSQPSAKHKT